MFARHLPIVLVALCLAGCGMESRHAARSTSDKYRSDDAGYAPADEMETSVVLAENAEMGEAGDGDNVPKGLNRKIIYQADVALVVEEFEQAKKKVEQLVRTYGGFVADANLSQNQGSERSGRWVVRIPVGEFDSFVKKLADVGVRENYTLKSDDVTEEFVDLTARIASKKKLEERVLELLDTSDGKIKDVLELERELERVRSEIERMEGRLRFLDDRTSLTTVTIHAREEHNYTPPEAPGFGGRIAATFNSSISGISSLAEGIVMLLVALLPWGILIAVVVGPVWYWGSRV